MWHSSVPGEWWGDSLRRAGWLVFTQGGQLGNVHGLAEAEVRQLHVAVFPQQQIVWLYIPAANRPAQLPAV